MWDETIGPWPETASTPSEFTTMMRQLKAISGLSLRELQARARRADRSLPPSTLAAALRSEDLPRDELLGIFVQACGCEPREVAQWRTARGRLAAACASGSQWRQNEAELAGSRAAPAAAVSNPAVSNPSASSPARPDATGSYPGLKLANAASVRLPADAEVPVVRRWLLPAALACAAGVLVMRTWRSRRQRPR